MKKKIIVIGNGMVSYKYCEKPIAKTGNSSYEIIVFGEESPPAYDRVQFSSYFSCTSADELTMAPLEWYKENSFHLLLGDPILTTDKENKTITSMKGQTEAYDKLILATASAAFVPPISRSAKDGRDKRNKVDIGIPKQ